MLRRVLLILISFTFIFFVSCSKDDNPVEPSGGPESAVVTISSTQGGSTFTPSGIGVQVIPGTVPQNQNGNAAKVSFSIESPIEPPAPIGNNAQFVGSLVKVGPEGFNFRWPVKIWLPYPEGADPSDLNVVYYDPVSEIWRAVLISSVDVTNRKISTDALVLGIYGLAAYPQGSSKITSATSCGGFQFYGENGYYYTLTVAAVSNWKYPQQQSWYNNLVGDAASSGQDATGSFPLSPTHFILPQATYQIWISRTKPGTLSSLPVIETYTVPATGTISKPILYGMGTPDWATLEMPGGGSWATGGPSNWPAPSVTYGTGDFQATLTWVNNSAHATDLDLHLHGPNEMHVYYSDPTSSDGSFQLDRDWRSELGNATENIYSLTAIPAGNYTVIVNLYDGSPVDFNVRILKSGVLSNFSGHASTVGEDITVGSFTQ